MRPTYNPRRLAAALGIVLGLGLHSIRAADFVAHEWGTFTSVQGADGVPLPWNPLTTAELPGFVHDRIKSANSNELSAIFASKSGLLTLQRMETPVIYFYTDQEVSLDVKVLFPEGIITEWFPRATGYGPRAVPLNTEAGRSFIEWKDVRILKNNPVAGDSRTPPVESSGSHYYAARATDANILRQSTGTQSEHEKFLFYRGAGNFRAPLQAGLAGNEDFVSIKNTGAEELRDLFVLQIRGGAGKRIFVKKLAAGGEQTIPLTDKDMIPRRELQSQIRREMASALVSEGLYEKEAAAMVETWNDSWFSENGVRVLYVLPRAWTDRVLPITFSKTPRELIRVMVGRAEIITPSMEWSLLKSVVKFCAKDTGTRDEAVREVKQLGLGRFLDPAIRRVLGKNPSREFSEQAWLLVSRAGTKTDISAGGDLLSVPWATPGGGQP